MAQTQSQRLPYYDGKNYAPIKPFLALQEANGDKSPNSSHYIADAIKEKYQTYVKKNDSAFREMISVGQMIALFIEGKQVLDWNPYTTSWTPRKIARSDPNKIKAVNFMQYYCTNWQSKWGSSNPDVIVSARSTKDQDVARARKANSVAEYLERTLYGSSQGSWFRYHEGLMAQCFGWYGRRVRPCYDDARQVIQPVFQNQDVQIGNGFGKCHDCGYTGSNFNSIQISQTDSMPVCPNCGSTAVVYEPPVTQQMQQQVGTQQISIPHIIAEQLPLPACRWDLRYRAQDSSWFIYEQEGDENAIRRALGNIRFPDGDTPNSIGLDAVAALSSMGSPVGGRSDTTPHKRSGPTITEFYLSADDLYDIKVNGDERTVDGDSLPQGARLSDLFPDGACALGLNGFGLLWGLFAEHHSKSVRDGVYHMKPLSGSGRGVADAAEIQKRFNRFDSQAVRWMQTRATPATLHAAGAIPANKRRLLGQPDVDIPIELANFPEVRSVRDLVHPLQGEAIPGDMLQYTYQHLSSFMQLAYHITDFSNGLNPRVKNDTATGAEILDANADSLFHPTLDIKAEVDVETIHAAFDLWCKFTPVKQFVAVKARAGSGARGMDLSGEDVEGDYDWDYVPGSQQPKNRLTKRRDLIAFYALFGGIVGYLQAKAQSPQEVAEAERAFDMDFATDDFDEIGEICRARFEYAKDLLNQSLQMRDGIAQQYGVELPQPDPMMILPEVKPTMLVTEPANPEKALWFQRLLDTVEGQEMSDLERNLVSAFIQAHVALAQGQAIALDTAAAEAQVAGNAPIAEADAQAQAADQQAQAQQGAAQSAQQHQQNLEAKQMDHDNNMERDAVKDKRALQREKVKQSLAPR
jgi:hypothetical protein